MSEEKVLTKGIAEQFLAFRPVDLIEFTEIKDAAAESLSKSKMSLRLDGLTQLSDAAVCFLGYGVAKAETSQRLIEEFEFVDAP